MEKRRDKEIKGQNGRAKIIKILKTRVGDWVRGRGKRKIKKQKFEKKKTGKVSPPPATLCNSFISLCIALISFFLLVCSKKDPFQRSQAQNINILLVLTQTPLPRARFSFQNNQPPQGLPGRARRRRLRHWRFGYRRYVWYILTV